MLYLDYFFHFTEVTPYMSSNSYSLNFCSGLLKNSLNRAKLLQGVIRKSQASQLGRKDPNAPFWLGIWHDNDDESVFNL